MNRAHLVLIRFANSLTRVMMMMMMMMMMIMMMVMMLAMNRIGKSEYHYQPH